MRIIVNIKKLAKNAHFDNKAPRDNSNSYF